LKLIIGLGNSGIKYKNTRHNIGRKIVEKFAKIHNADFILRSKFQSMLSQGFFNNQKIIFALPETFMNLSGSAVQNIASFYKIEPRNILIVQDDSDLILGKIKLQFSRSSAGHHGIDSITQFLGTKNFWRLRIGIRPIKNRAKAETFVLQKFSSEEIGVLKKVKEEIREKIEKWIQCPA